MKTYIQPNTEIIAANYFTILAASPKTYPGIIGDDDVELSNTGAFEEEDAPKKSSFWD